MPGFEPIDYHLDVYSREPGAHARGGRLATERAGRPVLEVITRGLPLWLTPPASFADAPVTALGFRVTATGGGSLPVVNERSAPSVVPDPYVGDQAVVGTWSPRASEEIDAEAFTLAVPSRVDGRSLAAVRGRCPVLEVVARRLPLRIDRPVQGGRGRGHRADPRGRGRGRRAAIAAAGASASSAREHTRAQVDHLIAPRTPTVGESRAQPSHDFRRSGDERRSSRVSPHWRDRRREPARPSRPAHDPVSGTSGCPATGPAAMVPTGGFLFAVTHVTRTGPSASSTCKHTPNRARSRCCARSP